MSNSFIHWALPWFSPAAGVLFLFVVPSARAQQPSAAPDEGARALWDTTFLSRRPNIPARRPASSVPSSPGVKLTAPSPREEPVSFLGIKLWRLRRSQPADPPGAPQLLHERQTSEEWAPEFVEFDKPPGGGATGSLQH